VARHGLLTTEQARRRHFPGPTRKTARNALCALADGGHVVRRRWGYDPRTGEARSAWLPTLRGLRRVGLDVPARRHRRASALQSLPHDATVVDVAERVLDDLAAGGVAAGWLTEAELVRGEAWLPRELAAEAKRPDGVLVLPGGQRLAVEVETTRHSARRLAAKVADCRRAVEAGVYYGAVWYCVPGGAGAAVERALHEGARVWPPRGGCRCAPSPRASSPTTRATERRAGDGRDAGGTGRGGQRTVPGTWTHLLATVAVGGPLLAWWAAAEGLPAGDAAPLVGVGVAVAGAGGLWPNIDRLLPRGQGEPGRRIPAPGALDAVDPADVRKPRRGWAHSLLACLVTSWALAWLAGEALGVLGGPPRQTGAIGGGLAALFGAGYLLHLGLDARTPGGVPFWAGLRPLLRAGWFGTRLALWPLWFVAPGLNPFARPEAVEIRVVAEAPPEPPAVPVPPADHPREAARPLPEAVRCLRCGTGHHPAAAFCQACGGALRSDRRLPSRGRDRPTR
jgi:hypothetical protein